MAGWTHPPRYAPDSAPPRLIAMLEAATLLVALAIAYVVLLGLFPAQLVLPVVSVALLAGAAILAAAAWWRGARPRAGRVGLWDLAGAFAFIGFAASMLSAPGAVLPLFDTYLAAN
jgi:hypothetical protein